MTSNGGASTVPDIVQDFEGAPVMSRPLMVGIMLVLAVESAAVHALLSARWPRASFVLLVVNVAAIWWIYREATAGSRTTVAPDAIEVRHGRSTRADIPYASLRVVRVPSWQDVPQAGTAGYLALSGGDDPNVLLRCEPPATVHLAMGLRRSVSTLGLRLEAPHDFVAAVQGRAGVPNP